MGQLPGEVAALGITTVLRDCWSWGLQKVVANGPCRQSLLLLLKTYAERQGALCPAGTGHSFTRCVRPHLAGPRWCQANLLGAQWGVVFLRWVLMGRVANLGPSFMVRGP